MSSPKVLILRAFSLNITSQNRAKGVRQSSYPVLNIIRKHELNVIFLENINWIEKGSNFLKRKFLGK